MQSHDRVSTTAAEGGRKSSKPIMEKRRRARINASLAELKSLLLEAIRKEGARHNKMEKADILEMAVKHLRQIQRQQFTGEPVLGDNSASARYQLGYQACAQEVSKYLDSNNDEEVELKTKLLNHLANCITGDALPDQISSTTGAGLSVVPGQTGRGLLAPISSSLQDKRNSILLSSSSSSLLPSSSSPSAISSSFAAPASSAATLLTSPLPQFLCSSSTSAPSAGVLGNAAPSVIIPIPISPLSIGTVSPASLTSGILTPEKQKSYTQDGSQVVEHRSHIYNHSAARSLDLSAVRISDAGVLKTYSLAQPAAVFNTQMDTVENQIPKAVSLMPMATVSTDLTNSQTETEVNNNVILPHPANQNFGTLETATGMIMVSSSEPHSSGNAGQKISGLSLEPVSAFSDRDKNNDNINNNNNSNSTNKVNINNTITFPAFVNLSTGPAGEGRPQQGIHLQQPQDVQLLHHQNHNSSSSLSQGPSDKDPLQPQLTLSGDTVLKANASIIANMNRLQLVPTKTASGEIALVLSTALLNPAPLALSSKPEANFAIPLHLPPAASVGQSGGGVQPIGAADPRETNPAINNKPVNQDRNELPSLQSLQSQQCEPLSTKNGQSLSESYAFQRISPTLNTPAENQYEQVAPLNLSSPNHKLSCSQSQQLDHPDQTTPSLSTKSSTDQLRQQPMPSFLDLSVQCKPSMITPSSDFLLPHPENRHVTPGYSLDKEKAFCNLPNSQNLIFHTVSESVTATRRNLELREPNRSQSYQLPSVAFVKPCRQDRNANLTTSSVDYVHELPSCSLPGTFRTESQSPHTNPSPPAAHMGGERRPDRPDAGQPVRHDRVRALFRPW